MRTFTYQTYITTTREKLWEALTSSAFTTRYWNGRTVTSDWQVGSTVTFGHDYDDEIDSTGTVFIADRPRRLSYGESKDASTTFELVQHGDVVALTVIHTGLTDDTIGMAGGGWSFILSNLKTLLETGDEMPMPAKVLAAYR